MAISSLDFVRACRRHLARKFVRGLTVEWVTSKTYEEIHSLVTTDSCRSKFHAGIILLQNNVDKKTIRVMLAAFLCLFPDKVFETIGEPETRLMRSARNLIESLTRDTFSDCLAEYLADYAMWTVPQDAMLAERIKRALRALHAVRNIPMGDVLDEVNVQTRRLKRKYEEIFGVGALDDFEASL
jgi:hypothetical protein